MSTSSGLDTHLPPLWWMPALAPDERMSDGPPAEVPSWATWIEDALAGWPTGHAVTTNADVLAEPAFAEIVEPLRPLIDHSWDQVTPMIGAAARIDVDSIRGGFVAWLADRLANLAARTLVTELHAARKRNELAGPTPRQRFIDFIRHLSDSGNLGGLFTRYPVLARLIGQACGQAVGCYGEFLRRFEADRQAIVDDLLYGVDPGELITVTMGAGDLHQGRSVAVVRFTNGAKIVYKPRCQRVQAAFGELVAWFNTKLPSRLELRVADSLLQTTYGWFEFVEHIPCVDCDQVDRFYGRLGALLALLYAVEATDVHYENLIACADQPVLIDVETVFHPRLSQAMIADSDPAQAALAASVCQTSLLPQFLIGDHGSLDFSGMGGDSGTVFPHDRVGWESAGTDRMRLVRVPVSVDGADNRPRRGDQEVEPAEHLPSLVNGFRAGYEAIRGNRHELLGEHGRAQRFATVTTRLVSRPTQLFGMLLAESTHPDLLRDGLDRDRVFDLLRQDAANGPVERTLVRHEIADLWAGDIPLFTVRPGSCDVWTGTGRLLPGLLDESGLAAACQKIADLSELDQRRQEWLIAAALGARTQPTAHHRGDAPIAGPMCATAPDPQRLLVEACGIADEIASMAVHDDGRANWVGMELVDGRHWALQPMGAGLANGYTGVALFLAQLGKLTGAARYTELAREAVRPLPNLIDAMTAKPDIGRAVGPGGFLGLGGIAYVLSRLACLSGDSGLNDCLAATIELVAGCADDGQADLTFGYAGGLVTMLSVYEETGLPAAASVAREFADRLRDLPEPEMDQPGFAMGAAGVAFALARFAPGACPYLTAARSMPVTGVDSTNYAWCTGLSGSLMALTALSRHDVGTQERDELDRAAAVLAPQRLPLRDLSLCHGELGVLDVLVTLAARGHQRAMESLPVCKARLQAILARDGPRCGTPNGVASPGLLTGLAGIGYGLLRLGFPHDVPSVLALEPGRSGADTDGSVR